MPPGVQEVVRKHGVSVTFFILTLFVLITKEGGQKRRNYRMRYVQKARCHMAEATSVLHTSPHSSLSFSLLVHFRRDV
jgi:hypothetical protein